MSDEVRSLSDELAQDPSSLAFLPLDDALRREGRLEHALRVAERGVSRHPGRADAHDLMARVALDRGELDRAADAAVEALLILERDGRVHGQHGFTRAVDVMVVSTLAADIHASGAQLGRMLQGTPRSRAVRARPAAQPHRTLLRRLDATRASRPAAPARLKPCHT